MDLASTKARLLNPYLSCLFVRWSQDTSSENDSSVVSWREMQRQRHLTCVTSSRNNGRHL